MEFETKIIKFGNSQGITIPNKVAKAIDYKLNDIVIITINDDKTIKIRKK